MQLQKDPNHPDPTRPVSGAPPCTHRVLCRNGAARELRCWVSGRTCGRTFPPSAGRGHTVPGCAAALLLVCCSSGWVPCFPTRPVPAQVCYEPSDVRGQLCLTWSPHDFSSLRATVSRFCFMALFTACACCGWILPDLCQRDVRARFSVWIYVEILSCKQFATDTIWTWSFCFPHWGSFGLFHVVVVLPTANTIFCFSQF